MKTLLTLTTIAIWLLFFISVIENLIIWQWVSVCLIPIWTSLLFALLLDNKKDLS